MSETTTDTAALLARLPELERLRAQMGRRTDANNVIAFANAMYDELPALAAGLRTALAERDEAITECRRRKGWDQDIAYWKERAEDAEAEAARLREALEYYADRDNYEFDGCPVQRVGELVNLLDMGQVARTALTPQEGGEK
jgi:hypothetical protein